MEFGITTFAESYPEPGSGRRVSHGERLRDLVEEAVVAEQVGLDVYGIGEHHRVDFAASAPAVVLAAIAARTTRLRLTSAVTVLSSADPVRTFQDFATIDLLSSGRAEIIAGRGSFTESFPLFGYDLADYDEVFAEKLDLLLALRDQERVTWSGRFRPALHDQPVYPRPQQDRLPVWLGVGGNPPSVVRAGTLGLPMALAIIGGQPQRFAPLADLHRRALAQAGNAPQPIAVHAHGYVGESAEQAKDDYYPSYAQAMTVLGRERGWPAMTQAAFARMSGPAGSLVIGAPEQVAEKIVDLHRWLGIERFLLHISVGTLPHKQVLRSIELLGSEVAPLVNAELASS